MVDQGGGTGGVFAKLVAQAVDVTGSHSYVTRFPTTATPICHTRLSLLGVSGIVVIGYGWKVTFETRYEY